MIAEYSFRSLPQIAMMKYIGTRTISQKTKKRTRSKLVNVPAMPVSSSKISAKNPFTLSCGFGMIFCEYTTHRNVSATVSTRSGNAIPSTPMW